MGVFDETKLTSNSIGLEQSIKDDVERIKAWEFLEKDTNVLGFAYETETGRVRPVC